jgi:hypothetical protein
MEHIGGLKIKEVLRAVLGIPISIPTESGNLFTILKLTVISLSLLDRYSRPVSIYCIIYGGIIANIYLIHLFLFI